MLSTTVPPIQAGLVDNVTFEKPGVKSTLLRSGLRIEYLPVLTRSVESSHNPSPVVLHSGESGKVPSSNPSKYKAP